MSYGLELRKPDGSLRLRLTDRLMKLHSVYEFAYSGSWTSGVWVPVTGMAADGSWVVFASTAENTPTDYGHSDATAQIRANGFYLTIHGTSGGKPRASVYRC